MLKPNEHLLVMLNDNETWTEIKGCKVLIVSDRGLLALQNGEDWDRLIPVSPGEHVPSHEGPELLECFELDDQERILALAKTLN